MKVIYFIFFTYLIYSVSGFTQPTQIGGIINTYSPVTDIDTSGCEFIITVSSSIGFSVGDTVMIIQMKGATVDTSNSASFGTVLDFGNAGNYEFSTISSISGNQIIIAGGLLHDYQISGHVQLITVPVYTDADVTTTLTCQDWDGSSGGVLVFFVTGALTLNADINIDGRGFRGGTISNNPDGGCGNNNINDYFYDVDQGGSSWLEGGAEKGEGITEISSLKMGGKGCLANGGGGGNKHNTGGGGGGNYTSGGKGGNEMEGCAQNGNGGIGGVALPYNSGRIFLGGGGGCGDFNNSVGTVGTDAGGIIIFKASTIEGNGHTIHSNGFDQLGSIGSIGDGAGGGGAGGTILLSVQNFSGNLTIQANGGDGGDQTASNTYGCFGPGGGGGAGVISLTGTSLPGTVITEILPGEAGIVLNTLFSCYNTTYGAVDGTTSSISYLTDLILPYSPVSLANLNLVDLGNDTTLCPGNILTFNLDSLIGNFLWSNGDTASSFTIDSSGTYWVQLTTACGIAMDTIVAQFIFPSSLTLIGVGGILGNDTILCPSTSLLLGTDYTGLGASYQWQDGSFGSQFLADSPGIYFVTVKVGSCVSSDTFTIDYYPPFVINLGNDTAVCNGTPLMLDATDANAISYLWQDGSTNPTLTAYEPGLYFVEVTNDKNCNTADSISISENTSPVVKLPNDTTACVGTTVTLHAFNPDATYLWSTNETSDSIVVTDTMTYWVMVTNECGSATDTFSMKYIDCNMDVFLPNAFTPNGDGLNDVFKPIASNIIFYHLRIYNRWGQLIFQSTDPDIGWDGKLDNKNEEIGVYVYIVNYVPSFDPIQQEKQIVGNLTLIR